MEIPDVIAVNKMDHPAAQAMAKEVRSVVALDPDGARAQAAALERRLAAGEPAGALAGVPIGVKDLEDAQGFVTTCGDPARGASPAATSGGRHVRAILFADFRGFSRLRDQHFATFVDEVLGTIGRVLRDHDEALLWRNSWGDAIQAVRRTTQVVMHRWPWTTVVFSGSTGVPPSSALSASRRASSTR